MNREEALKLLRGGNDGVQEWNQRREAGEEIPSLREANLCGAQLREAHLHGAELSGAELSEANLSGADLTEAHLSEANLRGAFLVRADLHGADLRGADLIRAAVPMSILQWTAFDNTKLFEAVFGNTILADVDLSLARGLESVNHFGPSTIGLDTLVRSKGRIPEVFLRGCGLQQWEILSAKLNDPNLTPFQIADILTDIQSARANKPLFTGAFMSYSHDDREFVQKLYDRLKEKTPVWLDRHDMTAGPIPEQIGRAIRLSDVLVLVLSEASIKSDWVLHELEVAHEKEMDGQHVLCPVAIDRAWKDKLKDVYWKPAFRKHVVDFSKWRDEAEFDKQFANLWRGLRTWYGTGQVDAGTKTPSMPTP